MSDEQIAAVMEKRVVYLDEALWLYNELAMICRWQGDLIDSRSILAQAELLRRRGQGNCNSESQIHFGIQRGAVDLEMGNVRGAMERLERAKRRTEGSNSILELRAEAYLALADHIRGEFELARTRYKRVLKYCRDNERLRAVSLFNRYYGDLLRRRGMIDDAVNCYDDALSAAASHPDLFHHARIAQAALAVEFPAHGGPSQSARYLTAALNYAREAGLPRLEADVATVRSEIRLSQGELDGAAEAAREAIAICSRRGMRLRVISNLVKLGRVQAQRGDRQNARIILDDAYRRASNMFYVTMAREAHEALIGVNGST